MIEITSCVIDFIEEKNDMKKDVFDFFPKEIKNYYKAVFVNWLYMYIELMGSIKEFKVPY